MSRRPSAIDEGRRCAHRGDRAFTSGVYPRQGRFLYDGNERYRGEMGKALLG